MTDRLVCVSLLFFSLLYLHLVNGAVLHIYKRSTEGPLTVSSTVSRVADDPHEGATRLRHILPIWWHYFRPLVQATMQDDHFRRELEKQFEHEYDMFGTSGDETGSDTTFAPGTVNNASPTEVDEGTAMGSIIESSEKLTVDDPTESQETNIIHETSEVGGDTEQIIEATQTVFPFTEQEEVFNEATTVNGNAESESDGNQWTGESLVDDANAGQEVDNSGTVESDENHIEEFRNDIQTNAMFAEVDGVRSFTDDRINSISSSSNGFEQPSQEEVDSVVTHDDRNIPNTNTAMWNNNAFGSNVMSTQSEGIFDDRSMQFGNSIGMFANTDDITAASDASEQPVHSDDSRFSASTWMFPAAGDSNTDSDFVPNSFSAQHPFFAQAKLNLEPDSSS